MITPLSVLIVFLETISLLDKSVSLLRLSMSSIDACLMRVSISICLSSSCFVRSSTWSNFNLSIFTTSCSRSDTSSLRVCIFFSRRLFDNSSASISDVFFASRIFDSPNLAVSSSIIILSDGLCIGILSTSSCFATISALRRLISSSSRGVIFSTSFVSSSTLFLRPTISPRSSPVNSLSCCILSFVLRSSSIFSSRRVISTDWSFIFLISSCTCCL